MELFSADHCWHEPRTTLCPGNREERWEDHHLLCGTVLLGHRDTIRPFFLWHLLPVRSGMLSSELFSLSAWQVSQQCVALDHEPAAWEIFRAGTQRLCLPVWQIGAFEIQDCLRRHRIHRDLDRRSDVSTTVQLKKLLLLGIATSGSDILFYLCTHSWKTERKNSSRNRNI